MKTRDWVLLVGMMLAAIMVWTVSFAQEEPYTQPQSYAGVPDKLVFWPSSEVTVNAADGTWRYSVQAQTTAGVAVLVAQDGKMVEAATITLPAGQFEAAYAAASGATTGLRIRNALLKAAKAKLTP